MVKYLHLFTWLFYWDLPSIIRTKYSCLKCMNVCIWDEYSVICETHKFTCFWTYVNKDKLAGWMIWDLPKRAKRVCSKFRGVFVIWQVHVIKLLSHPNGWWNLFMQACHSAWQGFDTACHGLMITNLRNETTYRIVCDKRRNLREVLRRSFATTISFVLTNKICLNQQEICGMIILKDSL